MNILKPSPLETLKHMVATNDPKERIRIYESAQDPMSLFDKFFGKGGGK